MCCGSQFCVLKQTQILLPKRMFPSLAIQGNMSGNNVSATTFPSLARPQTSRTTDVHQELHIHRLESNIHLVEHKEKQHRKVLWSSSTDSRARKSLCSIIIIIIIIIIIYLFIYFLFYFILFYVILFIYLFIYFLITGTTDK